MSIVQNNDPFAYNLVPVNGLWADREKEFYPTWEAEGRFLNKIAGGFPKQTDVLHGWLKTRFTEEDDIRNQLVAYVEEKGGDISQDVTVKEALAKLKEMGEEHHGIGFHQDADGLFMPARCLKANIKEATNVRFPIGEVKWGVRTKKVKDKESGEVTESDIGGKSPLSIVKERVEVVGERIHFYDKDDDGNRIPIHEPFGTMVHIGHPKDKFGNTTSTLAYVDYLVQPYFSFVLRSSPDYPTEEQLIEILIKAQHLGLWALHSQSYGKFEITDFRRL